MDSSVETIALPLSWSPGPQFEGRMAVAGMKWLAANPEQPDEDYEKIVIRTIYERIDGNLRNPALAAYPTEVSYETIWGTLVRTKQLSASEDDEAKNKAWNTWRDAMDYVWSELVPFFAIHFTKPPRTND
jgi:hypothetical protein